MVKTRRTILQSMNVKAPRRYLQHTTAAAMNIVEKG